MNMYKKYATLYKYQLLNLICHISFSLQVYIFGIEFLILALITGIIFNNLVNYLYIHRIYTHKHFVLSKRQNDMFLFLFCMLNLGSPAVYATTHMAHHAFSGDSKDPHDPIRLGLLRTMLSLWDKNFKPDRKIFARFLKDDLSLKYHKSHFKIATASSIFLPFLMLTAFYMSKIVIIPVHLKSLGYGISKNRDTSKNCWYFKPLTWGEELHNNHHINAGAANHNFAKSIKEFDILYYIGKFIERLS